MGFLKMSLSEEYLVSSVMKSGDDPVKFLREVKNI